MQKNFVSNMHTDNEGWWLKKGWQWKFILCALTLPFVKEIKKPTHFLFYVGGEHGNMVIWWLSTNISTIYTLQIQAILSFNNQCLGSKEKKTKICVPTELESASMLSTARHLQMSNIHMKAVRPPLLVCLSYAVLNLSTKSFIALQEDKYKKIKQSIY
jgi:hypothetical protein